MVLTKYFANRGFMVLRLRSMLFCIAILITSLFFRISLAKADTDKAFVHLYESMDKYHTQFDVYTDLNAAGNHFSCYGKISSPGDWDAIGMLPGSRENPYSGDTCIRGSFKVKGENWGGFYFLNGVLEGEETQPKPNWGDYPAGGFDLNGATEITFWARGAKGGEKVEFFACGVGRDPDTGLPIKPYPDSSPNVSLGYVELNETWTWHRIDLAGVDLSYVLGGFGWVTNAPENDYQDIEFYLDDIQYDKSGLDEPRFILSYETIPSDKDFDKVNKNVTFTYDNALALLSFIARGTDEDWRRAKLVADAFVYAQGNDRFFDDGRLRNAYQAGDLKLFPGWKPHGRENTARMPGWWDDQAQEWLEDRVCVGTHTGNLSWVMIALLTYYENKGGQDYLDAAKELGDWIFGHTHDDRCDGGYTGGYEGWEPLQDRLFWKSTEHNIDCYVAFMKLYHLTGENKWLDRALHAKEFIESMWNEISGHFWVGTMEDGCIINKSVLALDPNTWGFMAFWIEKIYADAISWAEDNCFVEKDGFKGFDFNTDRDGVWFEGTGQMVVAYRILKEDAKMEIYLSELRRVQLEGPHNNGKGIIAASRDDLTTGMDWKYYTRLHIGATCWYIFGELAYNPLTFSECLSCGDVNGDKERTPEDALLSFMYYLGILRDCEALPDPKPVENCLNQCQKVQAEVTMDDDVTPADALCIFQRYLLVPSCLDERPQCVGYVP